jgi:hypothetical protein
MGIKRRTFSRFVYVGKMEMLIPQKASLFKTNEENYTTIKIYFCGILCRIKQGNEL